MPGQLTQVSYLFLRFKVTLEHQDCPLITKTHSFHDSWDCAEVRTDSKEEPKGPNGIRASKVLSGTTGKHANTSHTVSLKKAQHVCVKKQLRAYRLSQIELLLFSFSKNTLPWDLTASTCPSSPSFLVMSSEGLPGAQQRSPQGPHVEPSRQLQPDFHPVPHQIRSTASRCVNHSGGTARKNTVRRVSWLWSPRTGLWVFSWVTCTDGVSASAAENRLNLIHELEAGGEELWISKNNEKYS